MIGLIIDEQPDYDIGDREDRRVAKGSSAQLSRESAILSRTITWATQCWCGNRWWVARSAIIGDLSPDPEDRRALVGQRLRADGDRCGHYDALGERRREHCRAAARPAGSSSVELTRGPGVGRVFLTPEVGAAAAVGLSGGERCPYKSERLELHATTQFWPTWRTPTQRWLSKPSRRTCPTAGTVLFGLSATKGTLPTAIFWSKSRKASITRGRSERERTKLAGFPDIMRRERCSRVSRTPSLRLNGMRHMRLIGSNGGSFTET